MSEEITKRSFRDLGLSEKTLKAIERKGFEEPTEIQSLCIPLLLEEGTEVIGQAETGTGKTAAFALPILETVDENSRAVQALILTPTRELALQVAEEINSLNGEGKLECTPIYGGASMETQIRKLKKGVQIVVGTPGRILDHIKRGTLVLSSLTFMVLDEADEMLDMGFIEDIEEVLKNVPENRRMLMFSATVPPQIQNLASSFMKNPQTVRTQKREEATKNADQIYYEVREEDKMEALTRIIDRNSDFYGVIFCRTKNQCDEVGHTLQARGYEAEALHGDLSQREREIILRKMKEKTIRILVATDVAARGLDIQDLSHVINYSLPHDAEIYIHRVGRTGRAGKEGTAITFITPKEARRFSSIRKASKAEIRKEEIPSPQEVVERKKEIITEELEEAIKETANGDYREVAEKLLTDRDSTDVLSSLLYHFYHNCLDVSQYKDIQERKKPKESAKKTKDRKDRERPYDRIKTPSMDEGGVTRLFIARGKNDGLTKKDLVDIIYEQTGVRDRDLRDISVMDEYSFVNAPYDTAEHILEVFRDKKYDGRTIITKAKAPRSERKEKEKDPASYAHSARNESDEKNPDKHPSTGKKNEYRDSSEKKERKSRKKSSNADTSLSREAEGGRYYDRDERKGRAFNRDEEAYLEWEREMEEARGHRRGSSRNPKCSVKERKTTKRGRRK